MDSSKSNFGLRLVRSGENESLEKHFSFNGEEQSLGILRSGESSLVAHPEPMVILPSGQPRLPPLRATTSEWFTLPSQQPLSENSNRARVGSTVNGYCLKEDSSLESDRICCDGQPIPSETSLVLPPENKMHLDDQKLSGAFGDTQAHNDFAPRPSKVKGSINSLMEVERDGR